MFTWLACKVVVCIFFFGPYVYMEEGSNFSRRDVLQHFTYQFFFCRKVFRLVSLRPTGISIWTYQLRNGYYLVVGVGIFRF